MGPEEGSREIAAEASAVLKEELPAKGGIVYGCPVFGGMLATV
jgi:hypothetical protein